MGSITCFCIVLYLFCIIFKCTKQMLQMFSQYKCTVFVVPIKHDKLKLKFKRDRINKFRAI